MAIPKTRHLGLSQLTAADPEDFDGVLDRLSAAFCPRIEVIEVISDWLEQFET
jgi:hypothetical protein